MTKKQKMYIEIEKHGNNLLKLFPASTEQNPIKLSKKLFSIENKAHGLSTDYCNGDLTIEQWDTETDKMLARVNKLLANNKHKIFINGDARGYALKINDSSLDIHRDFGGYAILAPNFN